MISETTSGMAVVTNTIGGKRLTALVILVGLLVGLQGWQAFQGFSTRAQAWQYAIIGPSDEELPKELGRLGSAGWEIVSARRATTDVGGRTTGIYELIMRRPARDLAPGALPDVPQP